MKTAAPENFSARACVSTYVVFGTIGGLPLLLSLLVVFKRGASYWSQVLLFAAILGFLLLWVFAFKIEVNSGVLSYRSLFGLTRKIPLDKVERAETNIGMNEAFGPFHTLVIYPTEEGGKAPLKINMKVFSRQDLHRLFDILGPKLHGKRRFSVLKDR